ncbi:hypothetical protein EDC01DRAFT_131080 [Geopyxis carbonaria]|nr:hypothetical protein EDC01DRAFT_131080 [Geopyxis carbonaria]
MFPTRRLLSANPHATTRTYYDADLRQGQSLIRARRPYLLKNTLTGLSIFAFVASVYIYTIKAVSQDNFEDVKVPDAPIEDSLQSRNLSSAPLTK